jgi:restriction system protein
VKIIEKRIVLVDGRRLCDLMATHGVGVSTSATYEIKRVATEYFED